MNFQLKKLAKACIRPAYAAVSCFNAKRRPASPEKILVVAAGYLGDTFWALQTVPLLKKAYPDAEIHVAGRAFTDVLANGIVEKDRLHRVSIVSDRMREAVSWSKLKRDAAELRDAVKPDLVIDLMCNRYSAAFCCFLKAYAVGSDVAEEASPLYHFCARKELFPSKRLACRPVSIVKQFLGEASISDAEPVPPVPEKTKEEIFAQYGIKDDEKLIMLVPGAGWEAKKFPKEKFHLLARHLAEKGCKVIVSGSDDERPLCSFVSDGVPGSVVACGSLSDTVSLLPHCAAVVGNDTGVIHVAEAFGVRTISIYCATNPLFSCALSGRASYLAAKCPFSPSPEEQYCRKHAVSCSRPEWMSVSVEQVEEIISGEK